eukprot:jgi/Mesvir1/15444/Mv06627-RA.1
MAQPALLSSRACARTGVQTLPLTASGIQGSLERKQACTPSRSLRSVVPTKTTWTGIRPATTKSNHSNFAKTSAGKVAPVRAAAAGTGKKESQYATVTFFSWLHSLERDSVIDLELVITLNSIASACKQISSLVARAPVTGLTGMAGGVNESGDDVKKLDIISNDVFAHCLSASGRTGILVSEEQEAPVALQATAGDYIVCFDPIDGSSNIDAAVTTGSIFGIYTPGDCAIGENDSAEDVVKKCLANVRKAGNELVAAGYCMYSSSTILVLTLGKGVYGFTLDPSLGEFVLTHNNIRIPDPGQRIYSANEGNGILWAPEMIEYIDTLKSPKDGKPYSLRYIGALVGDFHRTLLYGGYGGCSTHRAPEGKARLLYEVAPMAMLAEQAGGLATWGVMADQRVLDVVPTTVHQRSPMYVGSASEVRKLQAFLKAKKK